MWKMMFRVVFWGGLVIMVAPDQVATALKGVTGGLGLIAGGVKDMAWESAKDTTKYFFTEGIKHPTEGAVGWSVIGWIRDMFN